MKEIKVTTERGTVLTGVLFSNEKSKGTDTVMISITGIHGNFYQKTARRLPLL